MLRIGNWEWFLVWVEGGNKLYNLTHCCSKTPSWISAGWVSPKLVGDFFYSRAYIAFGVILSNIFIVQRFWRKKVNFPKSMGWVGVVGYKFHGFCTFWPRWSQKPAEFETEAEKRQSAVAFVISIISIRTMLVMCWGIKFSIVNCADGKLWCFVLHIISKGIDLLSMRSFLVHL